MNAPIPLKEKVTRPKETAGVFLAGLASPYRAYFEELIGNSGGYCTEEHSDPSEVAVFVAEAGAGTGPVLNDIRERYPMTAIALHAQRGESAAALEALRNGLADRLLFEGESPATHRAALTACLLHYQRRRILERHLRPRIRGPLFITGASGFLGGHFVSELLRCTDARIILLSRAAGGLPFDKRFNGRITGAPRRVTVLEGDITLPGLGLSGPARERLAGSVEEVWHFAASTGFEEILRPRAFSVNLGGTQNLLRLCEGFSRLRCLNHVSTAYVSGRRDCDSVIYERVESTAPEFTNAYEESKYHAELAVSGSGFPFRIFRPGIVMGHSLTGDCDGKSVYTMAKIVRMAKMLREREAGGQRVRQPFRVAADATVMKNLIPVDSVVETMLQIAAVPTPTETVFHITNPAPTPMDMLVRTIARALDIHGYLLVDELDEKNGSPSERLLAKLAKVYRPYMRQSDPLFDRSNTSRHVLIPGPPAMNRPLLLFLLNNFVMRQYGRA